MGHYFSLYEVEDMCYKCHERNKELGRKLEARDVVRLINNNKVIVCMGYDFLKIKEYYLDEDNNVVIYMEKEPKKED